MGPAGTGEVQHTALGQVIWTILKGCSVILRCVMYMQQRAATLHYRPSLIQPVVPPSRKPTFCCVVILPIKTTQ